MEQTGSSNSNASLANRVGFLLFLLTGATLPLYAFPIGRVFGKPIDVATVAAILFVIVRVGARPWVPDRSVVALAVAGAAIPLLVLVPPRPSPFSPGAFASSYAHWLLVLAFFVSASTLRLATDRQKRLCLAEVFPGLAVAAFALYQVVGIPRGWPATGAVLAPFQREPFRFDPALGYVRPTSIFLEPAWMGGYLVWVFVLSVILLSMVRRRSRPAVLLASAVLLAAILASVSWGTYVDLLVVVAVMSAAAVKGRLVTVRFAAGMAAILALLVAAGAFSAPGRRVVDAARTRWMLLTRTPLEEAGPDERLADSTRLRLQNARHAARLAAAHPLRGVGFGQYAAHAAEEGEAHAKDFRDPWCGWLAIAAEAGVGGPLLLAGALLLPLRPGGRSSENEAARLGVVGLVAFAAAVQAHTGSYIDLWWWYPLSAAAALRGRSGLPPKSGIL